MPYVDVNDLHMHYEEAGEGEPLVLLLGATGSLEIPSAGWATLIPSFAEHYHTFHVEQRGHGRTNNPAENFSYVQMADDAAKLIDQLGIAPAHVAGISDGGIVALILGMTRPELLRSLVAVGANYRQDDQTMAMLEHFTPQAMERESPEWVAAMVAAHDPHQFPGYWRDLIDQLQAMFLVEPTYSEADLQNITTPTLLIAGETDPFANLEQMLAMRRNIPDSEMLILNQAGMDPMANHVVQHTRADIVGPVILDFLARHAGDPAA